MQVEPKAQTPLRFGKYLLLERIGRGGMAEVYRSKTFGAAGFVKECAIKKILATLLDDEQFVQMFIDEAKLTAHLNHPNIVQVLDLGEIDGHLFIAMEYVQGKDLLDVLARSARRGIRIPIELTLYVVTELLKGLDFAHAASNAQGLKMHIVHRDVSPSNVLISYDGHVKVGDFGIAKSQMQSSRTEVGTQKGKTGYMSPEQVTGRAIDSRSDLFAAAVILFEMLTMTRLFKAPNDLDVMLKIRDADIEEDMERVVAVTPALEPIIRKGLCRRPEDRFQTGAEFAEALRDFAVEQRIKLSGATLAAYLQELFADKIETERQRRAEDPIDDTGFAQIASAVEAMFRYRDRDGAIHGPMKAGQLEELLASRVPNDVEAIAVGGADWRPVHEIAEFTVVPRPGPLRASEDSGATQRHSGADWEDLSLAGINPRARRRLRAVTASSESGAIRRVDGTTPVARDPGRATTREIMAVDGEANARARATSTSSAQVARSGASLPVERTGRDRHDAKTPTGVSMSIPGSLRDAAPTPASHPRTGRGETPAEIDPRTLRDVPMGRRSSTETLEAVSGRGGTPTSASSSGAAPVVGWRAGASGASRATPGSTSGAYSRVGSALTGSLRPGADAPSGRPQSADTGAPRGVGIDFGDSGASSPFRGASRSSSGAPTAVAAPPSGNVRAARITANHPVAAARQSPAVAARERRERLFAAGPPGALGDVGAVSVFRLIHRLHAARATGALQLSAAGNKKTLYFERGELAVVDSDFEADDLLAVLRRADRITAADAARAATMAADSGASLGEALVAIGALPAATLFHELREQVHEVVLGALFWEEGTWRWWDDLVVEADPFAPRVNIGELLARGVTERGESRYFRRFYRDTRSRALVPVDPATAASSLSLPARAMRVVGTLNESPLTVPDVIRTFCDRYNWPEGEVYRTLYLLTEQEAFRFDGDASLDLP